MHMLLPSTQNNCTEWRIDTLILLGKISPLNLSPDQACEVFGDLLNQANQSIVV